MDGLLNPTFCGLNPPKGITDSEIFGFMNADVAFLGDGNIPYQSCPEPANNLHYIQPWEHDFMQGNSKLSSRLIVYPLWEFVVNFINGE